MPLLNVCAVTTVELLPGLYCSAHHPSITGRVASALDSCGQSVDRWHLPARPKATGMNAAARWPLPALPRPAGSFKPTQRPLLCNSMNWRLTAACLAGTGP